MSENTFSESKTAEFILIVAPEGERLVVERYTEQLKFLAALATYLVARQRREFTGEVLAIEGSFVTYSEPEYAFTVRVPGEVDYVAEFVTKPEP